jgi:hypothetical protein
MLDVLADGNKHTKDELRLAIDPSGNVDDNNLRVQLTKLNEKLRPIGQEVVCISLGANKVMYRHMRLINTGE